jgi:deazaflavin-dependent oxidoreductase (nitroreductase family)
MTPSKLSAIPTYVEVTSDPGILKTFNDNVVKEFRANGGRVGGPFEDSDIVLLTMTGAKSGQPRLTLLEYFPTDGRIVLIGTYGGAPKDPLWVRNLRAIAEAHVEVGTESYDVVAWEVFGDEREALFAKVREMRPRIGTYPGTARVIPVFELQRV